MGVSVGRLDEIKAARPTGGKLVALTATWFERAGRLKAFGTQPYLLALTAPLFSPSPTSPKIGIVQKELLRVC
jgi:hypothetical protein